MVGKAPSRLTPPQRKIQMTDLALGGKWGWPSGKRGLEGGSESAPRATPSRESMALSARPVKPIPVSTRNDRRVTPGQEQDLFLSFSLKETLLNERSRSHCGSSTHARGPPALEPPDRPPRAFASSRPGGLPGFSGSLRKLPPRLAPRGEKALARRRSPRKPPDPSPPWRKGHGQGGVIEKASARCWPWPGLAVERRSPSARSTRLPRPCQRAAGTPLAFRRRDGSKGSAGTC